METITLKTKEQVLEGLMHELNEVDVKLKDIKRSHNKVSGDDKQDYLVQKGLGINDAINIMIPKEEVNELNKKAQTIIEKMLIQDPTLRLDLFQDYGY